MRGRIVEGGGWEERDVSGRWIARHWGTRLMWTSSLIIPIWAVYRYMPFSDPTLLWIAAAFAWAWAAVVLVLAAFGLYFALFETPSTRRMLVRTWNQDCSKVE